MLRLHNRFKIAVFANIFILLNIYILLNSNFSIQKGAAASSAM